jgi:hypothetical protein
MWVKLEVPRAAGRPSAPVRVMVMDLRGARQMAVILSAQVMRDAKLAIGSELDLMFGAEEHEGWIRVAQSEKANTGRRIGKLPQTESGIVRFALPPTIPMAPCTSTDVSEWQTERGAVSLELPAAVRDGTAPVTKSRSKAKPKPAPIRPAIPLKETPKPVPPSDPRAKAEAEAVDAKLARRYERAREMLRRGEGTLEVSQKTSVPQREVIRIQGEMRNAGELRRGAA